MSISEEPFSSNILEELEKLAIETIIPIASKLDINPIEWIDTFIYEWQQNKKPPILFSEENNLIPAIAALWASELKKLYGWEWVTLTFHEYEDWQTLAIVSPNRSLMILPFVYINACISDEDEVKIVASLVALENNIIPPQEENSYIDIMQGLQRIIPRY